MKEESKYSQDALKNLIALYFEQNKYNDMILSINNLLTDNQQKQAYLDYYNLLSNIKKEYRLMDNINDIEVDILKNLAQENHEIASFSKALLERANKYKWVHEIENGGENLNELQNINSNLILNQEEEKTRLLYAIPNPAQNTTNIHTFVSLQDIEEDNTVQIVVKSIEGKDIYRHVLVSHGENITPVSFHQMPNGIYLYSLEVNGVSVSSKKLVIIH